MMKYFEESGESPEHEQSHYKHHKHMRTLKLSIGYNTSDVTFGWKGAHDSLIVYYLKRIPYAHSLLTVREGIVNVCPIRAEAAKR